MCTILLSIKPEYSERILSGEKKFEFRRKRASRSVNKILIYTSAPKMKVVGEVEVTDILKSTPCDLWKKTFLNAGISRKKFMEYFFQKECAYAYQLGKVTRFKKEKTLADYGIKTPPQSFVYID